VAGTTDWGAVYGGTTVEAMSDAPGIGSASVGASATVQASAQAAPSSMGSLSAISWAFIVLVALGAIPRIIYEFAD
jgi:hypothetical protein